MHYEARPAWRTQWAMILLAVLLLLLPVLFSRSAFASGNLDSGIFVLAILSTPGLIVCLTIVIRRYSWLYTIDNFNIESRQGLLARSVRSIRLQDLRNINVKQTIMQRLLNIGDVEFSSAGTFDVEVVFYGVSRPLALKDRVQNAQA